MRRPLIVHPASRCAALTRIDVDIARPRPGLLRLNYVATGAIDELRLPPVTATARCDELWQHTCFEAFLRPQPGSAYYEFNLAPSTRWAAYRFTSYRQGMTVANEITAPCIDVQSDAGAFKLKAEFELPGDAIWHLGISAVIEELSGAKSYWALAHPPGKADFHHTDSFAIERPPA